MTWCRKIFLLQKSPIIATSEIFALVCKEDTGGGGVLGSSELGRLGSAVWSELRKCVYGERGL